MTRNTGETTNTAEAKNIARREPAEGLVLISVTRNTVKHYTAAVLVLISVTRNTVKHKTPETRLLALHVRGLAAANALGAHMCGEKRGMPREALRGQLVGVAVHAVEQNPALGGVVGGLLCLIEQQWGDYWGESAALVLLTVTRNTEQGPTGHAKARYALLVLVPMTRNTA